jgi:hypothetical protein
MAQTGRKNLRPNPKNSPQAFAPAGCFFLENQTIL